MIPHYTYFHCLAIVLHVPNLSRHEQSFVQTTGNRRQLPATIAAYNIIYLGVYWRGREHNRKKHGSSNTTLVQTQVNGKSAIVQH